MPSREDQWALTLGSRFDRNRSRGQDRPAAVARLS